MSVRHVDTNKLTYLRNKESKIQNKLRTKCTFCIHALLFIMINDVVSGII